MSEKGAIVLRGRGREPGWELVADDFRGLLDKSPDPVVLTDGRVLYYVNDAAKDFLGLGPEDGYGDIDPKAIFPPSERKTFDRASRELAAGRAFRGEVTLERSDGAKVAFAAVIHEATRDAADRRLFAATFRDLSARKAYELELKSSLFVEDLTGLANRRQFVEQLGRRLQQVANSDETLGLIAIDVDRFKSLNDSLGPSAGDRLLIAIADRVQLAVRTSDLVARLSGDEFVVLCHKVEPGHLEEIARRIREAVALPFSVARRKLTVAVSMGLVEHADGHAESESVLQDAITAVAVAKERGGDQIALFDPVRRLQIASRVELEQELRRALHEEEFELAYQKEVWLRSGDLVCLEALIRWRHPRKGIVPPDEFIPIAESTGLISPIGDWVFAEVCRQLKEWESLGMNGMCVSVNVSPRQLVEADFPKRLEGVCGYFDVRPNQLNLEITESMMTDGSRAFLKRVRDLRDAGFTMIMDDFGTGYSSLSQLRSLPFSVLKIDKAFVLNIVEREQDRLMVDAMVRMAHALGRVVVAEGVETQEHVEILTASSCDIAQGWHYGRPVSAEEISAEFGPAKDDDAS
ncbi:MAG: EAL domain-containing protein [Myxococcota bacterium]